MKILFLTALLLIPLSMAIFKPIKKPRPKFDRQANEQRVQILRDLVKEPCYGWNPPMPEQPDCFPSDPDCLTSGFEP